MNDAFPADQIPGSDASPDPQAVYAVGDLIAVVRDLAARLEATARQLHAGDHLSVAERQLLLLLRRSGPQTIPQLAQGKKATRQYVQQALHELAGRGLVAWRDNPAHRRSRLADLTPTGVDLIKRVMRREGALVQRLARNVEPQELTAAANALRTLSAALPIAD